MAKNGNDINSLIKEAIDASIEFEKLMDSIDFNSYLEEDKNNITKDDLGWGLYDKYINAISEACNCCEKLIKPKKDKVEKLISELFRAKIIRLKARKGSKRKEEEKSYIDATHKLHKAFDKIDRNNFDDQENCRLTDNYNWAKVLYFNELAICYSGLAKSSMSLGYAEQSISILEKLYVELKNLENLSKADCDDFVNKVNKREGYPSASHVLRLYTFALYNKGEAEKLLHEEISALRTFRRIARIYKYGKKNDFGVSRSDYHSALLREALIFIDQGRGKEAMDCLDEAKKAGFDSPDYRIQDCDLERASALIDQKEYEKAWGILEKYTKENWNNTFAQRKAKVHILRLLNEFRRNRSEEFEASDKFEKIPVWGKIKDLPGVLYEEEKPRDITINLILTQENKDEIITAIDTEDKGIIDNLWKKIHVDNEISDVMKAIKDEYTEFEGNAIEILKKAAERQDGDNFKKTCTNLAEYYQHAEKDSEKSLKCFYLYLFESEEEIFPTKADEIIKNWLGIQKLDVLLQLQDYPEIPFDEKLDRVEDERYLRDFFDVYVSDTKSKLEKSPKDKIKLSKREKIVKKLKDRLESVFLQKDNDIEAERAGKKYEDFCGWFLPKVKDVKEKPEKFIEDYFFKNSRKGNSREGMRAESIEDRMERNTDKYVKNVVGTSKIHNEEKEKLKGKLSVLRRWNSFTPALSSPVNQSKGGGYFLHFSYKDDTLGIVIDPGYDFLENFFSQGFKIGDIDLVLVSHAHPDHTDNLQSILSLFYEMNGRLGKYYHKKKLINKKTLTLILSPGVFEHYRRIIKPSEEVLKDTIIVNVKGDSLVTPYTFTSKDEKVIVKIQAFVTSHRDLTKSQSLGFRVIAKENTASETVIGYTGDAKWNSRKWPKHFKDCNIACVHLGSIVKILGGGDFCNTFCEDYAKNDNDNKCKKLNECKESGFENVNVTKAMTAQQIREENHLYLAGLASFFDFMSSNNNKLKVGIVSEFGEELKNGIRMDLYNKFNDCFPPEEKKEKKRLKILPGDIGLHVDVFTGDVYCHCCERFVERNGIVPIAYGKEEAICFVCEECRGVLSPYQIGEKLKNFCENGRTLELADEFK